MWAVLPVAEGEGGVGKRSAVQYRTTPGYAVLCCGQGLLVAAAMWSMSSVEVFEARIASGLHTPSHFTLYSVNLILYIPLREDRPPPAHVIERGEDLLLDGHALKRRLTK